MDVVKNFAKVSVSTGYAAGATSITLSTGHGAKLPDPAADGAFNLVWWNVTDYPDPTDDSSTEIVRCTARVGDVLTVTRAQESTADVAHNAATKTYQMILSLTKKMIDDISSEMIRNIVEDTTPQLGGNLDMQTHKLVGEGGSDGVYVDSSGNVGLGTTTPRGILEIVTTGDGAAGETDDQFMIRDDEDADGSMQLKIGVNTAGDYSYIQSTKDGVGNLHLALNQLGGNVAIGTTAPTAKLDVNSDIIRLRTAKTPATAGAAGNQGDIAWDADYIYVCVATNTWKRSALTTW